MSGAITVGEVLERAELGGTAVAGTSGLGRTVTVPRIQKPGLVLTGWPEQLHSNRVLVLGGTQVQYLEARAPAGGCGIETLLASKPACIVVCRGLEPPAELAAAVKRAEIALLISSL